MSKVSEIILIIKPKNDYSKLCEVVKRKYFEYLGKGVNRFRFLIVSSEPLHKWIESVRCVLEINISATIVVNQVREEDLRNILQGLKYVEEIN